MSLSHPDVRIDQRTATFKDTTYSISHINSVAIRVGNGHAGCAMVIGLCALAAAFAVLFGGESLGTKLLNFLCGLGLSAGLLWLSSKLKPSYAIVLGLGAGEEIVYSTTDEALANRIEAAIRAGML